MHSSVKMEHKLIIISSALNGNIEAKLLEALKKNMDSFAWSIKDIKRH